MSDASELAGVVLIVVCCGGWPLVARAGLLEVRLLDDSGASIADAVVSLRPIDGRVPLAPPAAADMDQRNKQFVPHVLAVQRDASVRFPNSDQIRHHVYSFSEPKRFELRLYSGEPAEPVVFDQPGTVVLGCNIHDGMLGYVRVVDTPWFARSDASGQARIEGLPAGRYLVELWHPRLPDGVAPPGREVSIPAEGGARLEAQLALGPPPLPLRPIRPLRDRLRTRDDHAP